MSKRVTKISPLKVVGEVKDLPEGELYKIVGETSGYEVIETQYGTSYKFVGSFKAENSETGEQLESNFCYMPGASEVMLKEALDSRAENEEGHKQRIQFALCIGKEAANNPVGYEYTVQEMIPREEKSLVDQLLDTAKDHQKQLGA